jgi:hypothetical protein
MKKETKLQAAFKDLNKEMRKLWFLFHRDFFLPSNLHW